MGGTFKKMKSVKNCDTVFFKDKYITYPKVTLADAIFKAYQELVRALQGRSNIIGQTNLEALTQANGHQDDCQGTNTSHNAWHFQCSTSISGHLWGKLLSTNLTTSNLEPRVTTKGTHITGYAIFKGEGNPWGYTIGNKCYVSKEEECFAVKFD